MSSFDDDDLEFYKILLTGDSQVGKTSLWFRLVARSMAPTNLRRTIGSEIGRVSVLVNKGDGEGKKKVTLSFLDTAGLEKHRSLPPALYRNTNLMLLVCDLSYPYSLNNLRKFWAPEARTMEDSEIPWILIANKLDKVTSKEDCKAAAALARELRCIEYFETSAIEDDQTKFDRITKRIAEILKDSPILTTKKSSVSYKCSTTSSSSMPRSRSLVLHEKIRQKMSISEEEVKKNNGCCNL